MVEREGQRFSKEEPTQETAPDFSTSDNPSDNSHEPLPPQSVALGNVPAVLKPFTGPVTESITPDNNETVDFLKIPDGDALMIQNMVDEIFEKEAKINE